MMHFPRLTSIREPARFPVTRRVPVLLLATFVLVLTTSAQAAYLDRCATAGDCTSGLCLDDLDTTRFCSQTCVTDAGCADEHLCVGGQCVPDDTGKACSGPGDCRTGLCLSNVSTGSGECTRGCADALSCPAGFACSDVGLPVCIDIERPCSTCPTGVCLGSACTSSCTTAADCPTPTFPGFAYGCVGGFCQPSPAVLGSDPIGAVCSDSPTPNTCRSGFCDADPTPDLCSQACDAGGNCGFGFGCVPRSAGPGGGTILLCEPAGVGDLGTSCSVGADCRSALCVGGVCSRLCADSLCPTGFSCATSSGAPVCEADAAPVPVLPWYGPLALLATLVALSGVVLSRSEPNA